MSGQVHVKQSYPLGYDLADLQTMENQPVIFGSGAFYTVTGQSITATRLSDGKSLWNDPLGSSPVVTPVIDKDTIYVITPGGQSLVMYAFNTQDGSLEWRQDLVFQYQEDVGITDVDDHIYSTLVRNNILYLGTSNGAAAFDLTKRTVIWYQPVSETAYNFSQLVLQPAALYLLSQQGPGALYVLNPQNGKTLWAYDSLAGNQQDLSNPFSIFLMSDASVYEYNNSIVQSLNPLTGTALWKIQYRQLTDNEDIGQLLIGRDGIYLKTGPSDGDILALNLKDGSKLWDSPGTDDYQMLATGQGRVYALGQQTIYAFNARTGALLWKQSINANHMEVYTTANNLYVVDAPGLVDFNTTTYVASLNPATGKTLWSTQNVDILRSTLP
jgi:outer membrane protein assembly factor BamB